MVARAALVLPLLAARGWAAFSLPSGSTPPADMPAAPGASVRASFARLPLAFVQNRGQWRNPARFVASRGGTMVLCDPSGFALGLVDRREGGAVSATHVRLRFEGAEEGCQLAGRGELPGRCNFFLGNDPRRWRTGLPGFREVVYEGLYAGVDLSLRERGRDLEYDLLVAPGADLAQVVVRVEGALGPLRLAADGFLAIDTPLGEVRQGIPASWEEGPEGERTPVETAFVLLGEDRFGFRAAGRRAARRLVVDPGLVYSTFLGGVAGDVPTACDVDPTGAAIVSGRTMSPDFPVSPNAYDTTLDGLVGQDAVVSKLDPSGSSLLFSTFLGGTLTETVGSGRIAAGGEVIVGGQTTSSDFPTTAGAFDAAFTGSSEAFVARLSPAGDSLLFSTFLGGSTGSGLQGLSVDLPGAVIATGGTNSPDFPVTPGAVDTTFNGGPDAYVLGLSSSGSALLFATFLGGSERDIGSDVDLLPAGGWIVAGRSESPNFPTTPGALDTTLNADGTGGSDFPDGFVTRLAPFANALVFSTYLGGSGYDNLRALGVDGLGRVTVGGHTASADFPVSPGAAAPTLGGVQDVFVTRLTTSGDAVSYSTFLGGNQEDIGMDLAVDSAGRAVVTGITLSANFPTTAGAYDTTFNGFLPDPDAFVARLSPGGDKIQYATLLGALQLDAGTALALDLLGAAIVTGYTKSGGFSPPFPAFPTTPGAFDTTFNVTPDQYEGFVAKSDLLPQGASTYGASTAGCAGLVAIGVTSIPEVGNMGFAVTCTGATPVSLGFLGLSLGALAAPIPLFGAQAWIDVSFPAFFGALPVTSGALGYAEAALPIPPAPGLASFQAYLQFLWPDPCGPAGLSASNALAVTVQP